MNRIVVRPSLLIALCASVTLGCSKERAAVPTRPAVTQQAPEPAPQVHGELVTAVETLSASVLDARDQKIKALRELANILDAGPINDDTRAATVRDLAAKLERLRPASLDALGIVHEALKTVRDALAGWPRATASPDYQATLTILDLAVEALGREGALTTHRADEAIAFRAATDAVVLAEGERPPFQDPRPADPARTYNSELTRARNHVRELEEGRWTIAPRTASRALSSLADAVAAIDTCDRSQIAPTIQFEAQRVRWARSVGVIHASSIQRGLGLVLDVLAPLDEVDRTAVITARAAVAAIDRTGLLSFQRPALIEAFRTVTAAFPQRPPTCRTTRTARR